MLNGSASSAPQESSTPIEEQIKSWSPEDLEAAVAECDDAIATINDNKKVLDAEIHSRFAADAERCLKNLDKWDDGGSTSIDLGSLTLKASRSRSVTYNSDALMQLAASMPYERANSTFTIKFGMSETTLKGVKAVDPKLASQIDAARTVKIGNLTLKLIKKG